MSGYGEIYVDVSANVVNGGINALSTSGEIGEGDSGGGVISVWLLWSYDALGAGGFTGKEWYWDDMNNPLQNNWNNSSWVTSKKYESGINGFRAYLVNELPGDLNEFLGNWDMKMKADFVSEHTGLGIRPANPSGCIEYRY